MTEQINANDRRDVMNVRRGANVKDDPAISIVIPNYKTARYIRETLDSVFAQTFTNYEVIVINDGAPDSKELRSVLTPFYDDIVFIDKFSNDGTSASRNQAVEHSRGGLISFLDADDIWFPTYLHEIHGFLTENVYDMVYADAETFGERLNKPWDFLDKNPPQGDLTRETIVANKCHILPSGTLIKKDVFLAAGGFDPKVARTEDFDLWMRLIFRGVRIGYLRKVLFRFRISPESGSGDSIVRIARCRDIWISLKKKMPFTEAEIEIIDRHIAREDAAVMRAEARLQIYKQDWEGARASLKNAMERSRGLNLPLKHRIKVRAVLIMLRLSPGVLFRLFRRFRAYEIDFMPTA